MPSIVKLTLESNQYERNIKNAQRQLNDFTRSIGINMKSLSGMALAAGAVTGALKVVKDAFFANEQQLDEWGRTVDASKALYNGFLNALNNGDISGYLSNINTITEAARAAYDALDELGTFNAFNQVNVERTRTGMTEAIAGYRLGESSKESVQAAAEAYKKELIQRQEKEKEAYSQAIRKIAAERGVPWGNLEQALSGSYGSYKELKEVMPTGKRVKFLPSGQFGGANAIEVPMAVTAEEKMGEALRALNDTELQNLQALGAQAERTGNEIANIDKQVARILNGKGGIESVTTKKNSGKVGSGSKIIKTEEQLINENIQKLTQEYIKASNDRQAAIRNEIKVLQDRNAEIQRMKDEATGKANPPGTVTMKSVEGISLQGENPFEKYKDTIISIKSPLQALTEEMQNLQAAQALAMSPEIWQAYQKRIEEVTQKMNEFTSTNLKKDADATAKSYQEAAHAIQMVGNALSSVEDPSAKIAMIVAQGIASIVAAYGDAMARDQSSKFNIYQFLGTAAAATIQMAAQIQQIHNLTGYEQGGIVDGTHFSGDNVGPVMLNAGELVLTRAMQNNLASELQQTGRNFNLSATITGEQIRLVLNNNGRRTGRGEYVTTNFS